MKRILSLTLAIIMFIGIIPIDELAYAQDTPIKEIEIDYQYSEREVNELESIGIFIIANFDEEGTYPVRIRHSNGVLDVGNIKINSQNVNKNLSFDFDISPDENIRIDEVRIGNFPIPVQSAAKITRIYPYNVDMKGQLTISGENLDKGSIDISDTQRTLEERSSTQIVYNEITSNSPGYKDIKLTRESGIVTQYVYYHDAFKLMGDLSELGTLDIVPQNGVGGSTVYITTKDGKFNPGYYSVFFLKDGIDQYSRNKMAEIVGYSRDGKVMEIKVPNELESTGSYEVQITNKVNPNGNIDEQIVERRSVKNKFFLLGADNSPVITSIYPDEGPETGEDVTINGRMFDELDFIGGLELKNVDITKDVKIEPSIKIQDIVESILGMEDDSQELTTEGFKIEYNLPDDHNGKYNGKDIDSITRYMYVLIGNKTTPFMENGKPVYSFGEYDSLKVHVPQSTVDREKEVDVIMVMQTDITFKEDTDKKTTETFLNIVDNDKVKYTIYPSYTRPVINKIIPDKIEVVENDGGYTFKEDMVIAIEGENFKVLRYKDDNGDEVANYPLIGLGANPKAANEEGIVLRVVNGNVELRDKNNEWKTLSGANVTILDNKGNIIDGTFNKETGNRIIITLPKNLNIKVPGKLVTFDEKNPLLNEVYVLNPIIGSSNHGNEFINNNVKVQFVYLAGSAAPTINSVEPNVVAIDSGEEITIKGSNFHNDARVFIGGVEVNSRKLDLDSSGLNTTIKFNAPKLPQVIEGPTKVMVMNPDGGIAVKDFIFVESLNMDPIITDFSPKKGSLGTTVVVDGNNFLKPNPSAGSTSGMSIYRLIGTRVLMDGKDINEYNTNEGGSIDLINYSNENSKLIKIDKGIATLADYAYSVILEDEETNNYYIIYYDNYGNIILSDAGSSGTTDNTINEYYIFAEENGSLRAEKGGVEYDLSVNENGLIISKGENPVLGLTMKTPYRYNETTKEIYGSRVKVIDKNRIEFTVPQLPPKLPDGYTITVQNPDTKKDTARDKFYYYESVSKTPVIEEIKPSVGSVSGGYSISIIGRNFEDDSKVYIDGLIINQNNVRKEIKNSEEVLTISNVPPYRRNMSQEGIDRKEVPVSVENGNGGTAIGRFTYIIPPSANPIIDRAEFQKEIQIGSAAGDEILTIIGRYFKFEEPWSSVLKNKKWKEGIRNGQKVYFEDLNGDEKFTSYSNSSDFEDALKNAQLGSNEDIRKLPATVSTYENYLISPILPRIYIGDEEAKIVEFGNGYIKVITPSIESGRHDLYIVNNDYGISNRYSLTFQSSRPVITKIVPNTGKKQGNENVEIIGSGFENSRIDIVKDNKKTQKYMPLVRFGNVEGIKDVNGNLAQVVLENGDFVLEYNGTDPKKAVFTMKRTYNKEITTDRFEIEGYNGEEIFLPIEENGYELVKVQIKDLKLIVERGYSPSTILKNSGQIIVETPSYYTVGQVPVEVVNPDGGTAAGIFTYKNPDSKPQIINITRDGQDPQPGDTDETRVLPVHQQGGSIITIEGRDFREGATIQIGNILDIPSSSISYDIDGDVDKLTFTMPQVGDNALGRLHKVVVINEDGGTASSDNANDNKWEKPIYIQFIKGESNPTIESIFPDRGPAKGGTLVTIKGNDFRDTMEGFEGKRLKVYFGESPVPQENIHVIDYKTIEVITPKGTPGRVEVKVENPDGTIARPSGYFTYISGPHISIAEDSATGSRVTKISVKGGQELRLIGEQFMEGARVVFAPVIRKAEAKDTGDIINIDGEAYILEDGTNGTNFTFVDETTALITTPEGKLGDTGLMLINPDGGASNIYPIEYDLPGLNPPEEVIAELVFDKYIKVHWNTVANADYYEIYEVDHGKEEFIGSTDLTSFLYKDIEPNSTYRFLVKAVGEFGSSEGSRLSNRVETGRGAGYEDESGDLGEYTSINKSGSVLYVTLGERDYDGLKVDLRENKYIGTEKIIITIPIDLVFDADLSDKLDVIGEDFTLAFSPGAFGNSSFKKYDGDDDAGIRFTISYNTGNTNLNGATALSSQLMLEGEFYKGKNREKIDYLSGAMDLTLKYDTAKASLRKIVNKDMYYFNDAYSTWAKVLNATVYDYLGVANGSINNLGRYAILGYRR